MAARLTRPRSAHLIDGDEGATLSRQSVGLSPAHVELIKLLAAVAVEQYLNERDAPAVTGGAQ